VESFIEEHRPLILRHARALVRQHPEKCAAEDLAKEIEIELMQLAKHHGLTADKIHAPDPYLREIAKHAFGRARRRRALLDQLSAGDDLDALSSDIAEVDADLPPLPSPPSPEGEAARETLERLKNALSPSDALICALLLEDNAEMDDVSTWLNLPMKDLATARERILTTAVALGIEPVTREDRRGNS
jgi:DNA-directed RNA polymerase specialized sigma24 family protein